MKSVRGASRVDSLRELCRFGKAIEQRGSTTFSQADLAKELGVSHRTVSRYLQTFREQLGLFLTTDDARSGSTVVGKWRFLDALASYYKRAI